MVERQTEPCDIRARLPDAILARFFPNIESADRDSPERLFPSRDVQ